MVRHRLRRFSSPQVICAEVPDSESVKPYTFTFPTFPQVICAEVPDSESVKPYTFTLTLKPVDGLEFAPGVFAADSEETMRTFLGCIKKFQVRSRQKRGSKKEGEKGEK